MFAYQGAKKIRPGLGAASVALLSAGLCSVVLASARTPDKLTFHYDAARSGWNAAEHVLTPTAVSSGSFGRLWRTQQLDSFGGIPPRVYASPLYVDRVQSITGDHRNKNLSIVYVVTSSAVVYAINAFAAADVPAGTILWRTRLSDHPCHRGTLGSISTPVIDLPRQRLYASSCDEVKRWHVHAIDIRSGQVVSGWPVSVNSSAINAPGVNKNGRNRFPETPGHLQRGALNLSPSGSRLYVTFGANDASGWLVVIDTLGARVASAFSTTSETEERQGGMWASGGASVDSQGYVHVVTGANSAYVGDRSSEGVFAEKKGSWGQSILRLRDDEQHGLELVGTYTPFNYCQTTETDIDLGSSSAIAIDLDAAHTSTPHLLALGGGKQGNAYLLDRARLPGGLTKRRPCSNDPSSDQSLLSPEPQPHFGRRGPINLFGPYSEDHGMEDQAKSRSTAAYFVDSMGGTYLFVTGSSKQGEKSRVSAAPGLARLRIVTKRNTPAYLAVDQLEQHEVFQNPSSPIVTSDAGKNAIVWVLDPNVPRTASLYGASPPNPVLYAFDALTFELLWKSAPGDLGPTGKYNEPTISRGTVFIGTDRLEAFGLRASGVTEPESRNGKVGAPQYAATHIEGVDAKLVQELGERLYRQRCSGCHEAKTNGAPLLNELAALDRQRIFETLLFGAMQSQAAGLTEQEMSALATFISK